MNGTASTLARSVDGDATRLLEPSATPASRPTTSSGALEPGENFGERYHIIRMLGMGGMGAVYQVWDAELEVALALKVVRPDAMGDPAAAEEIERRFKRELLLARKVTHPNVVRIHDMGEIDGIKYITMPYIEGTDLAHILKQRTLPVREALAIARQVAAGLEAAHDAGVVHRDLKPANIMIDAENRALIMDFGIARGNTGTDVSGASRAGGTTSHHSGATVLGTVVGTIEYMAPEQARGEAVDHRADIYAFGLILYRMLAGSRLSPGATDALSDLTARMAAAPPALRHFDDTIPEAVEALVSRCLQPDPAARYHRTSELVEALDGLDDDGVPLPVPAGPLSSWRVRAAAIAVLVASVVGTWLIGQSTRAPAEAVNRDPVAVLVADAVNRTGEPVFDGLLEQALTVGIEGAPFIAAYQRPAALRIARLLKSGDGLDEASARLVAIREGIKIVLLGAIEKRGNGYALSVRGIDPASGKELASSEETARNRDTVLTASGKLASRVRAALGDTRPADPKETLSSASLEAVAAFIRAQELSAAGRDQEALAYFKEAAERDPDFGRAYGGWAMSVTRLGRRDEAAELWKKALALTDRMTDRERLRMQGAYFTLVTRNHEQAFTTYTELVENYPADTAGHNNLAVGLFRRLEFTQAMEEGKKVLAIYPRSPLYRTNFALYAMYAGDFATAEREAQQVVDQGDASYDAYLPLAVSAIAAGRGDAARGAYDRMSAVDPTGASLARLGVADLELAAGRASAAVKILRLGLDEDRQRDNPAGIAAKQIALADALGMQRDLKGAVAAARSALAIDSSEAQIVPAVRWLIEAGNLDEAARLGETLDNRLETQPRAYGRIVAGQIALARGKRAEGVDALREALKLANLWLAHFHLGLAYLDAGYHAEALSAFEVCLKRRGEGYAAFLDDVPTTRYVAPLPYWIGRAREGLGLIPQARSDYEAFLATRASDSADSLTKDARARLTGP